MVKRTDTSAKAKASDGAGKVAVAGPADPIARNRAAEIIRAASVPAVPAGVRVEIDVRRRRGRLGFPRSGGATRRWMSCSAHGRMVQEGKARARAQSPADDPQKKG